MINLILALSQTEMMLLILIFILIIYIIITELLIRKLKKGIDKND